MFLPWESLGHRGSLLSSWQTDSTSLWWLPVDPLTVTGVTSNCSIRALLMPVKTNWWWVCGDNIILQPQNRWLIFNCPWNNVSISTFLNHRCTGPWREADETLYASLCFPVLLRAGLLQSARFTSLVVNIFTSVLSAMSHFMRNELQTDNNMWMWGEWGGE